LTARVLVVVGPTASGKSALAITWAQQLGGEVINADSVQIYRHFDIGSGKLPMSERGGVPHHLIDVCDPHEIVDAAWFIGRAEQSIADVQSRNHLPIVCGGTFLWVRALLYGLAPAPPRDEALRAIHQQIASEQGRSALHQQLAAVDPQSAQRLSPNDFVRVSRALEVFQLTGKPLSELQAAHGFKSPRYDATLLGIRYTSDELTARITERTEDMFAAGLLDEVRQLRAAGYQNTRAMQSVGYREVNAALEQSPEPNLTELKEAVVRKTRIFARRQRTWLREQPVCWLTPEQASGAQARAMPEDLLRLSTH
jgi:tRNA dimethylallyltransferase